MALADVKVVGVVNVTEDSFSDGGRFLDPSDALRHAQALIHDGADYVELGPAASHPDAKRVPTAQQIQRISYVLASLASHGVPVSVDRPDPEVQRFAAGNGATMINDVRGFPTPDVAAECAAAGCDLVVMHSVRPADRASRVDTAPEPAVASAYAFFSSRLDSLGPSIAVLRELGALRNRFARPLMISVSRKSFVQRLTGRRASESGSGSLAAELFAIGQGARYVRTHEVKALRDALAVLEALASEADASGLP
jgi:dihydropteroate synthase type 2